MANKAHTATLNRICKKLEVSPDTTSDFDITTNDMIVEVETSATVADAVERLRDQSLPSYIAVTNKEGVQFAVSLATGTPVGIMDPQGNIVVEARQSPSMNESPEVTSANQ